jgi:hypothetical protein
MSLHSASDEVLAIGQGIVIFLEPHELSGAAESAQRIDDRLKLVSPETGSPLNFRRGKPFARLVGEQRKNFFLRSRLVGCQALVDGHLKFAPMEIAPRVARSPVVSISV